MEEKTDWLDRRIKDIECKIGMIILGGIRGFLAGMKKLVLVFKEEK